MNLKIAIPVVIVAGLLTGCQTMDQQRTMRTLLGAGVGGLAGSAIGGGNGNKAAIAIGTLLGGLAGQSYGAPDPRPREPRFATEAERRAYECGKFGRCY